MSYKELELMRRDRDLLRRELELLKREMALESTTACSIEREELIDREYDEDKNKESNPTSFITPPSPKPDYKGPKGEKGDKGNKSESVKVPLGLPGPPENDSNNEDWPVKIPQGTPDPKEEPGKCACSATALMTSFTTPKMIKGPKGESGFPGKEEKLKVIDADGAAGQPGEQGYQYLSSVVDASKKFIRLYPCKTTTAQEVVENLKTYFPTYSPPRRIISDRGSAFTSESFKEFSEKEMFDHVLVAVGTPRANGQVERFNQVITPMFAKLCESTEKWDIVIDKVEFALNNTVCRSTGDTPSKLLFGVDQLGEINNRVRLKLDQYRREKRDLTALRESASEKVEKIQRSNEGYYNKRRTKDHTK